jgi:hypothetical protein
MKIHDAEIPVRDLTRWNRAALDRFRYVEGGAAEWLEYLRVVHMLLYARARQSGPLADPDIWRAGFETGTLPGDLDLHEQASALQSVWQQPEPQAYVGAAADYRSALRAQYDSVPLDQTAQIQRAFVRAYHILTETLNAYANEGFLATATQKPHLRRLLELIDFKPRLPASARVPIALTIAAGTPRQTLDRGLSVKHMPPDGRPILTFESLEPLSVDPGLNLLRAAGWNARVDAIGKAKSFALAERSSVNIALVGTLGLIVDGDAAHGFVIKDTSKARADITIAGMIKDEADFGGTLQTAEVLLSPIEVHGTRPHGARWLHFAAPPACYVGQIVALVVGKAPDEWLRIERIDSGGTGAVTIGGLHAPFSPAFTRGSDSLAVSGEDLATVQEVRGRDVRINRNVPNGLVAVYPATPKVVSSNPDAPLEDQQVLIARGQIVAPAAEPVGQLKPFGMAGVHVGAPLPAGLENGAPVALRMNNGTVAGAFLQDVAKDGEDGFFFTAALPAGYDYGNVVQIAAAFATVSKLRHETRSDAPLFQEALNGALDIEVAAAFNALLKPGRTLLIVPDPETHSDPAQAGGMAVTIASAARIGANLRLTFTEDLAELDTLRRGHTAIYGNVAHFSHGMSLPEKVLGSGDASIPRQVMPLPAPDIATRPDPSFPGGIVPDIEIRVGGRKLRQVSATDQADPLQPAYFVRLGEDGNAEAVFLSRLPTEADNVRLARFRQGSGALGNTVPPFAIVKPTPNNPVIDAMIQPLSPQFGADLEGVAALKRQGTSYFALLDRALSARDFARLAESTANVWHAHAGLRRAGGVQGTPTIVLTVVPAGGGPVGPLRADLAQFLSERAMPGTVLDIRPYLPAPVRGTAVVNLKAGYAKDVTIAGEIQAALHAAFKLEVRTLGRTLFVTELTAAIEAHEAVENLTFTLIPAWPATQPPRVVSSAIGAIQAVIPSATQAVFVKDADDIEILWGSGGGA